MAINYFPFHIGDYRAATAHLSNDEDLAYRRLLEMYYDSEAPIPLETQWVARRLRLDTQPIQTVLDDFFVKQDDGWHHFRCDREISEYRQLAEKNRLNGKKGGRPKSAPTLRNNPVGSQAVSAGMPVVTQVKGNQEPRTNNQEPNKPPTVVKRASRKCPLDFEVTDDMRTWAALECPTVHIDRATAKMRDHTFKNAITDWAGAWRNWLRRDAEASTPATGKQSEPGWRRDARERMQAAVPSIAEKSSVPAHDFFEAEVKNVTPITLG